MKTLAQATPGGTYQVKDWSKLEVLAGVVGEAVEPRDTLPKRVADAIHAEFNRDHQSPSPFVEKMAPAKRVAKWKELGIMPGGVLHENMYATSSCLTNVDGSYVSLALKGLRLGIATAYGAQIPLELAQDALWGTPAPHAIKVDLGIIDPAYVNIAVNGHEPMIGAALIDAAHEAAAQEKAKAAGAKGLRIVGSIETGQELVQRFEVDDVFVGLTGNWLTEELAVATGGLDVFAADMNCVVPTLGATCAAHGTLLVPVSDLVGVDGAETPIVFDAATAGDQAQADHRPRRRQLPQAQGARPATPQLRTGDAVAGFSTESILGALGGSLDPLLDVIKNGTLKGVCGLVSCTTLRDSDQDSHTVAIAKSSSRTMCSCWPWAAATPASRSPVSRPRGQEVRRPRPHRRLRAARHPAGAQLRHLHRHRPHPAAGRRHRRRPRRGHLRPAGRGHRPRVHRAEGHYRRDGRAGLRSLTHVNPVPFVTGAPNLVKLVTEDLPASPAASCGRDRCQGSGRAMLEWIQQKRAARL